MEHEIKSEVSEILHVKIIKRNNENICCLDSQIRVLYITFANVFDGLSL